ncbi:sulfatase-like hydrolase/transferase [Novosphingobium sediminicola]|uniref:Arylsulfatase A-like enzyme n=1 Tax=Novosphingobium sediminicola TaxID=563162 RepID=A0A7W6CGY9_9SPHN|nr:sulfatase-like hydrolase/transferase [Novosphingobium sediminicola]MBB3955652.1 arylsulfatase A-like enzyme [Novosphingobium sediminicola]
MKLRKYVALTAIAAMLLPTGAMAQNRPAPEYSHGPAASPATAPAPRRAGSPNVIFILADDIGIEAFNAYGGEYYTPNIDRLAKEGVRFTQAHATPLCSPSRVRLMTGMESHRNYEAFGYLAPGQFTFANMMKASGYATGIVGKWQLMGNGFDGRVGITPEQAGFDESYLWQLKALDAKGSRYWGPTRVGNGRTKISEEGFGPDFDSQYALDFISRHKDQPFFLYYPMVLVHNPFVPTPDSMSAQGAKTRFAAMVTYMDKLVGALMDRLKAEGLDENTVVIFSGDNGTNRQITSTRAGFAVRGGKGTPTLSGTHVPMIIRAPGKLPAGVTRDGLFDFADIMPTIAEASGAQAPTGIDGVSQWAVAKGEKASARGWIFQHYAPQWVFDPARYVFDARYKLYGDGRFVALDDMAGSETPMPAPKGEAVARKASLQKVLDSIKDGALSKVKFPWCAGQASTDPARPATEAGCKNMPQGEE